MLFTPFTFQNGKTAKNRIFKSAMEEQLAQNDQPSEKLVRLYGTWAEGGAGVLVTGNVMVSESGKGSINDVVISDDRGLEMLKKWAKAGTQNDTLLIMQNWGSDIFCTLSTQTKKRLKSLNDVDSSRFCMAAIFAGYFAQNWSKMGRILVQNGQEMDGSGQKSGKNGLDLTGC